MNVILKFANAKRVVTWHGAFGAATAKPLQIWSNNAENGARNQWGSLVIYAQMVGIAATAGFLGCCLDRRLTWLSLAGLSQT
jgi:predicted MFS family arabinose efflux permease